MAAMTTSLSSACVWRRFRCLAERHIEEGNLVAGERLWEIVPSPDESAALTIRSTRWTSDSVECAYDASTGALTCAPGTAIVAPTLTFHVCTDDPGMFRRGGVDCTVDEAVALVLDELVWFESSEGNES